MNTQEHELLIEHLHGRLPPDKHAALNDLLRRDAEAREWLRTESAVETRLRALAMEKEAEDVAPHFEQPRTPSNSTRWFSWRPLAAAAAGIVFGMLCTSVIFAHVAGGGMQKARRLFPLKNADFEQGSGKLPGNPPESFGIWTGGGAEIVEASSEARPTSGSKMLRFVRAETDPPSPQGVPNRCDVYQLIDPGPIWAQAGQDDEVTLAVRVRFLDTHTGPEGSGTFKCRLLVHPGEPEAIRNGWPRSRFGGCAYAKGVLRNGPSTCGQWRTVQAKVILPPPRDARIAAVHLGMIRFTNTVQPQAEFGQCYVDNVSLTVTARPLLPKE